MSSKRYYDESYSYHDNWCKFLNEQSGTEDVSQQIAADEARAQAAAEQEQMQIMALRQSAAPAFAEFVTIIFQLGRLPGDEGSERADIGINDVSRALSRLAHQEIDVQEFLTTLSREVQDVGRDLQRQQT